MGNYKQNGKNRPLQFNNGQSLKTKNSGFPLNELPTVGALGTGMTAQKHSKYM